MKNIAIVIPAKNEEDSITGVINDIRAHCAYPIIVIDDASNDNTAAIAKKLNVVVISHVINMGAWRATQTGMRYAFKKGYEGVVTIDADGQHEAKFIGALLDAANEGHELVIGSCIARGSTGRHIAWRIFKKITGLNVSDLTSGFRFYSEKSVVALSSKQATMFEYQDVGVLLMIKQLNMKCVEIPVDMNIRINGISRIFHSWLAVVTYLLYTFILSTTKIFPMQADKYHKKLTSGESLE